MTRGNAYWAKGNADKAIADFSGVFATDGKHADALIRRGLMFGLKARHDEAMIDFTGALKSPPSADPQTLRGAAHLAKDNAADALADFDTVLKGNPELASVLEHWAVAHVLASDAAAAAAVWKRAAAIRARHAALQPAAAHLMTEGQP